MIHRTPSWRLAPFLGLALLVALLATPVSAHKGEQHDPATPPAASDTSGTAAAPPAMGGDMSEMPAAEMSWPTGDEDSGMMMSHRPKPTTFEGRVLAWLGMWHPAVIHFPIGLLLTVAFLELAAAVRRKPLYTASNKILLAVAVIGAFVAAPLGWANAGLPTAQESWALNLHRWLGTGIPFLMLLLWFLKRPAEQAAARPSSRAYELALALSVVVILIQAYLGGEITHGANHMAF